MKIVKYIKNSLIDFPAKIATVLFTNGCNWDCWYCQNKKILTDTRDLTDEFFEYLESRRGWIDGVVICGGEPTIHPEIPELCRKIKSLGFAVKLDTNGTNPDLLKSLINESLVDYVAMDVKAPIHKLPNMVGSNNRIDKISQSISMLIKSQIDYEFRTTVCPDLTKEDIVEMAEMIRGAKRYYLQQYHKPNIQANEAEPLKIELLQEMCRLANNIVPTQIR